MPLATLGLILLGARLLDALIDPFIGRWCDRLFARSPRQILVMAPFAALVLAAGFGAAVFPGHTRAAAAAGLGLGVPGHHLCGLQRAERGAPVLGRDARRRRDPAQPHRGLARRPGAGRRGAGLDGAGAARACPAPGRCSAPAWPWAGWPGAAPCARSPQPSPQAPQPLAPAAAAASSAACWASSCSTALPARFRPRWCCSSCRTGCRRRAPGAGVPGHLFRLCRRVDAAVAAAGAAHRPGPQLAVRHAAGGGGLRLGRDAGHGRHRGLHPGLCGRPAWRWAPTWHCPARCWPA